MAQVWKVYGTEHRDEIDWDRDSDSDADDIMQLFTYRLHCTIVIAKQFHLKDKVSRREPWSRSRRKSKTNQVSQNSQV